MDNVRMSSVENQDFSIHDHFTFVVLYFPLEPGPRSEPGEPRPVRSGPIIQQTYTNTTIHTVLYNVIQLWYFFTIYTYRFSNPDS